MIPVTGSVTDDGVKISAGKILSRGSESPLVVPFFTNGFVVWKKLRPLTPYDAETNRGESKEHAPIFFAGLNSNGSPISNKTSELPQRGDLNCDGGNWGNF